jgi:hypothetical protein
MSFMHRLAAALLIACLVTVPRVAAADDIHPYGRTPLSQKEKLRWNVLMRAGKKFVDEEHWIEAAAKFSEAIKLDPHPEAFLWKGFAEEKLGHLTIAKAMYSEAWNEAKVDNLAQFVGRSEEALAELGKKIPLIVLRVPADVRATVSIDGASIVMPPEGADVNPGSRSVDVSAPGRQPFHVDVKAEEGQVYAFDVPLLLLAPATKAPPAPPVLPPVEGPRGCGACSVGRAGEALSPSSLAALAAILLGEQRRRRRRRA